MRGVALLIVVIHNASWIERGSDAFPLKLVSAVAASGWAGVQLFFVLSGFLITGILLDALGSPTFFRTFYIRRTLRIFPLYYGFLAFVFFVVPRVWQDPSWSELVRKNQWWYWSYLSNWASPFGAGVPGLSHFWSLAVEEQFYLLWPVLVFSCARARLIQLCAVLIATTPLIRLMLGLAGLPTLAAYQFTIARWDALAAGALLAILLREERGRRWLSRRIDWITGVSLVALVALLGVERGFHEGDVAVQVVGQTLFAVLSASLLYCSVVPGGGVRRVLCQLLSASWLRLLGKYSYATYVFHVPIHMVLSHFVVDAVNDGGTVVRLAKLAAYVACVATLSLLAAMASWRVLEQPMLRFKDRVAPRPPVLAPTS